MKDSTPMADYETWRARWADALADQRVSPEAEQIAGDLPDEAQIAITYGESPPWNLALPPVVEQQLAFFALLDGDTGGLNGLGIQVARCIWGWDVDCYSREQAYAKWCATHYQAATRTNTPGHMIANIAGFLDPDAIYLLVELAIARAALVVEGSDSHRIAVYLARQGLVDLCVERTRRLGRRVRGSRRDPAGDREVVDLRVTITDLGLPVARMLWVEQREADRIFQDAKCSAFERRSTRLWNRTTEQVIAELGRLFSQERGE